MCFKKIDEYNFVNVESYHKDFIINLNKKNMPAVGELDEELYYRFLEHSDYFKLIRYNSLLIGFLVGLLPNRPYYSVNYKWFENKYKSFIYIDRIVILSKYQNMGFGSLFYDDLRSNFKNCCDFLTCEINIMPSNDVSMKFHKKYGFKEVGQQRTENDKKIVSMQLLSI